MWRGRVLLESETDEDEEEESGGDRTSKIESGSWSEVGRRTSTRPARRWCRSSKGECEGRGGPAQARVSHAASRRVAEEARRTPGTGRRSHRRGGERTARTDKAPSGGEKEKKRGRGRLEAAGRRGGARGWGWWRGRRGFSRGCHRPSFKLILEVAGPLRGVPCPGAARAPAGPAARVRCRAGATRRARTSRAPRPQPRAVS